MEKSSATMSTDQEQQAAKKTVWARVPSPLVKDREPDSDQVKFGGLFGDHSAFNRRECLTLDALSNDELKLLLSVAWAKCDGRDKVELVDRMYSTKRPTLTHYGGWHGTTLPYHSPFLNAWNGPGSSTVIYNGDLYLIDWDLEVYSMGPPIGDGDSMEDLWKWKVVETKGNKPEDRGFFSAVVFAGKLWVFGGVKEGLTNGFSDMNVFDFETHSWSIVQHQGVDVRGSICQKAAVIGNKMYVVGSTHYKTPKSLKSIYEFDFSDFTWNEIHTHGPAMKPGFPADFIAVEEDLYLAWAADRSDYLEVFKLDFSTREWVKLDSTGTVPPKGMLFAGAVLGRSWVMSGGIDIQTYNSILEKEKPEATSLSGVFEFNLDTHEWSTISTTHRVLPMAVQWVDSVLFLHGVDLETDTICDDVQALFATPVAGPASRSSLANVDHVCGVRKMFKEEILCDVELIAGEKRIKAHKSTLAASSPVFCDLFLNENQQKAATVPPTPKGSPPPPPPGLNTVELDETIDPRAWQAMVEYIYWSLDFGDPMLYSAGGVLLDLFRAADHYDLDALRQECVVALMEPQRMAVEDVAKVALVAAQHSQEEVFQTCVKFAAKCFPKVSQSGSFRTMWSTDAAIAQRFTSLVAGYEA